ncbi:F0F1 ATP synthase subunit epsilon [bacterium]|nr:F0F1 ATP synthase subunit epsilon [bacterium]
MAGTMQFDLVSPEKRLASMTVTEVMIPGAEGDLTAMEGHTPVIVGLRTGTLRVVNAEGVKSFVVTGGFAEVTGSSVSVLAERVIPFEEATGTVIDTILAEARSLAAAALPEDKDMAEKNVADALALHDAILKAH